MLTEEQAKKIEERFRRKTGPKNWGKPIITSAALKWQQMGMSPVDLNIIESDKMDLRSLCSVYHVPSELFNDASNKTYSNTKEAGSAVYTNAVLPALNQLRDAFNLFINPRYEGKVYVDYDASMISELQDDLNYMTQALSGAWWLTPNERRDMMNFGMDEKNTLMDEYWLPVGLSPITGAGIDDEAIEEAAKRLGINDYKQ
jgi:HK97 family phage portal protein